MKQRKRQPETTLRELRYPESFAVRAVAGTLEWFRARGIEGFRRSDLIRQWVRAGMKRWDRDHGR